MKLICQGLNSLSSIKAHLLSADSSTSMVDNAIKFLHVVEFDILATMPQNFIVGECKHTNCIDVKILARLHSNAKSLFPTQAIPLIVYSGRSVSKVSEVFLVSWPRLRDASILDQIDSGLAKEETYKVLGLPRRKWNLGEVDSSQINLDEEKFTATFLHNIPDIETTEIPFFEKYLKKSKKALEEPKCLVTISHIPHGVRGHRNEEYWIMISRTPQNKKGKKSSNGRNRKNGSSKKNQIDGETMLLMRNLLKITQSTPVAFTPTFLKFAQAIKFPTKGLLRRIEREFGDEMGFKVNNQRLKEKSWITWDSEE